jgi:hypothetical protein
MDMKMKITLFMVLIGLMVSMNAIAKDEQVTIDGKNITVTDVDKVGFFKPDPIHSNDLKDGVCVISDAYPNIARIIRERLVLNGIKPLESLHGDVILGTSEKCKYLISLSGFGSIDISNVEKQAAYSALPTAGQVVGGGGQMIGSVVNSARSAAGGGAGGLIGFAIGALWSSDSKLVFQGSVITDPVIKIKDGRGLVADYCKFSLVTTKIFYKLEKGKEATDDIVFKMAVDQWLKHYVIFDTPVQTVEAPQTPAIPVSDAPAIAPATDITPSTSPSPAVVSESTLDKK